MTAMTIDALAVPFELPGVDGRQHTLEEFADKPVLVVVFTCNHCPYAQGWEGRLIQLQRDYVARGVAFVAINANDPVKHPGDSFAAMQERFQPDKAAGQSAVIGWDIAAPDGNRTYQVKVENGTCAVEKGGTDATRVTLGLSLADFMRFIGGKLDGMQAFMGGKLKLQGDMMFAQTLQTWFGQ